MKRILLKLEYRGTQYSGWQVQNNAITVQKTLENALFRLTGEKIRVTASGRTDEGVHALCQVVHFDTESTIPPENFCRALKSVLPPDVVCFGSQEVSPDFHARFSAKRKTYVYRMYRAEFESALLFDRAVRVDCDLDVSAMQAACVFLIGEHDFASFLASGSAVKDTVRTVFDATLTENGEEILFEITGNGFLYNMVRIIVGTLLSVGEGKLKPEQMKEIIQACDRSKAGRTAPPQGLYLKSVEYDALSE